MAWSELNPIVTWDDGTIVGLQYGDFTATPTGVFLAGALGDLPSPNAADFWVRFSATGPHYRNASDQQSSDSALLHSYIPSPLGVEAGDLLLVMTVADASVTVTVSDFTGGLSPWTTVLDVVQGGARFGLYTRTATAVDESGAGSHNAWVASAVSHSTLGKLLLYRNAIIDVQAHQVGNGDPTAPSVPASGDGVLVCLWAEQIAASGHLTLAGGFTQRAISDASISTSPFVDTEAIAGDKTVAAGATGAQISPSTAGTDDYVGWSIVVITDPLRPGGPAGGDPGFNAGIFAELISALDVPTAPSVADGVQLAVNNNGHLRPFVGSSGTGPDWALMNDGAWHHVQVAISSSGGAYGNGQVTAVVDAVAQTPAYDIFAHPITDTRIVFGIFNNSTTWFTNDHTSAPVASPGLRWGPVS